MGRLQARAILPCVTTLVAAVLVSGGAVTTQAAETGRTLTQSVSAGAPARMPAVFRLTFDNGETLRPGTRVRDSVRPRNNAIVRVSGRGRLTREAGIVRRGAGYPNGCRRCGRALLEINDARSLDPRRRSFQYGAAIKVSALQVRNGRDPNLVQKGLARQPGGQFKLELLGSRPRCVVSGRAGRVSTPRGPSVADGRWHRLDCTRRGGLVRLRLDGAVVAGARGRIGRVANAAPVRIGGKAIGAAGEDDQYHGDLDSVFLRIAR